MSIIDDQTNNDKKKEYPKVLIISHNPFSNNFNMGRTLSSFFDGWESGNLAQLYFRPDKPTGTVCHNFYQFTDIDALKSIILRNHKGNLYVDYKDINTALYSDKTDAKLAYNIGLKKIPIISFIRDLMWSMAGWNNKFFKKWINCFDADVVFLAAGDYSFSYKIAYKIAQKKHIPLVVCFFDDYLINDINDNSFVGRINNKRLIKWAKRAVGFSNKMLVTNDLMAEDYSSLFGVSAPVLYTVGKKSTIAVEKTNNISYIGNLGLGRYEQLLDLGKSLVNSGDERLPKYIDVYSSVDDLERVKDFTLKNGIKFHGAIPYSEVELVINRSLAVLHVESFDDMFRKRVHYSLSTKIADSLGSRTVLVAYGPREVASIKYLIDNNCALVIDENSDIQSELLKLYDEKYVNSVISKAKYVFEANHQANRNHMIIYDTIKQIAQQNEKSCNKCRKN